MRQTNVSFALKKLGLHVLVRRREKRREEEEEEGEDQTKVCFILNSWVFWIPKVLVWRLAPSFLGFCGRDHQNPRFVEVIWVKSQLVEKKHGIIIFIWFL